MSYTLTFLEKKSKNFSKALELAMEVGGTFKDGKVTIEIENSLNGYLQIRQLFNYVQNWKGTSATYNGNSVKPYLFLLEAQRIGECYDERLIDSDCGTGFGCKKLENIKYHITGPYFKTHTYWYNYGHWKDKRWIIDKNKIYSILMKFAQSRAIVDCPFFDETKLWHRVNNLPEFLVSDGVLWETVFEERFINGERMQIPFNIKHRFPEKGKRVFCGLDY